MDRLQSEQTDRVHTGRPVIWRLAVVLALSCPAVFAAPPLPSLSAGNRFVYEDGSTTLSVTAVSNSSASSNQITLTISGIQPGWSVVLNGGSYDPGTGTWTRVVPVGQTGFTGGPGLAPPPNSDVDMLDLVVTATNTDTATGQTSSKSITIDVFVDAVGDLPGISVPDAISAAGDPAALEISASVTDTDGSEELTAIQIQNVGDAFTLSAGTNSDGGIWTLNSADLVGLEVIPPNGFAGNLDLVVMATASEVNKSDVDFSTTNDSATRSAGFRVTWEPTADDYDEDGIGGAADNCLNVFNPGQQDSDGDATGDACDCGPYDPAVIQEIGPATNLRFTSPEDLEWEAPLDAGGPSLVFDLLRSENASDFASPVCVTSNTVATEASDDAQPESVLFYLVRADGACGSNAGSNSAEVRRVAGACP